MAKSHHKQQAGDAPIIKVDKKALDPALASLFATSAGPVQAPPKSRYQDRIQKKDVEELSELDDAEEDEEATSDSDREEDDEELSELEAQDSSDDDDSDGSSKAEQSGSEDEPVPAHVRESALNGTQDKSKKRKRGNKEEIEDAYLRKLALEEEKEEEARQKKRKTEKANSKAKARKDKDKDGDAVTSDSSDDEAAFEVPKHESLTQASDKDAEELEKAARTVFLGNVSTACINSKTAEKALKKHLESFIPDLADNTPPHKIVSIRYRSTAFDNSLPKRAAFAKKEIMDSTTRSTNAYAVYSTKVAAREAVKRLNGTVLLARHLHVDSVAHPTKTDHRRCVFVGNLPFVDDASSQPATNTNPNDPSPPKKKSTKPPSDIEEGLWTHFAKAGKIESVRVVRDAATRVGKGFAYVQFHDENGVEAALQYNEKAFPPMLPRKLRVTRCRAEKKNKAQKDQRRAPPTSTTGDRRAGKPGKAGYVTKLSDEQKSMQGRARSMLGKVAKAQSREGVVFEGHRARESQGKSGLKFKGSGAKKGVNGRKSRSSAWKKGDRKK